MLDQSSSANEANELFMTPSPSPNRLVVIGSYSNSLAKISAGIILRPTLHHELPTLVMAKYFTLRFSLPLAHENKLAFLVKYFSISYSDSCNEYY